MREHGGITRLQAMEELGIANVTARISELRGSGINVVCDMVKATNRYGEKIEYGRWRVCE